MQNIYHKFAFILVFNLNSIFGAAYPSPSVWAKASSDSPSAGAPYTSKDELLICALECQKNDNFAKAQHLLQQSYHRGNITSVLLLGHIMWLQGKPYEAMQLFDSIITQDYPHTSGPLGKIAERHACILNQLGVFYKEKIGDRAKAKLLYKRAIKIGNISAKSNLGILYEEDGNIDKALTLYRVVTPVSIYANLNMLYVHGYKNVLDIDEVRECIQRIENFPHKIKSYKKQYPMRWIIIAQVIQDAKVM